MGPMNLNALEKEYRAWRGATRHAYDGAKAAEVFAAVPPFLEEARHLLASLRGASVSAVLDLAPRLQAEVRAILATHVPDCTVYAFGSRATGNAPPYSDLDLAVLAVRPLAGSRLTALRDAFAESDLPIEVDVIDWRAVSASFRDSIRADLVAAQEQPTND